jgi:hypothetical protein
VSDLGQVALVSGAGIWFAVLIVFIARRGNLSMRYTLGWLFVATCVVLGGLFSGLVGWIGDTLDVEPAAVVLTGVMAGFLGITVQLSISVSGLTEAVRTLAELNAILEERICSIEMRIAQVEADFNVGTPPSRRPGESPDIGSDEG